MRVIVTKPVDGTVTIDVDDRKGATGQRTLLRDVPVESVREALSAPLAAWEKARADIREVRRRRRS